MATPTVSPLVEVDAGLARYGVEAVLLDGLEGLGGAQLDEAPAGLPLQLLVLQVHKLQARARVAAPMGRGRGISS